jgi:hypothetical protein
MELSTTQETTGGAATLERLSILWNPKVRYRIHTSSPHVPILLQTNPVNTTPFYLFKIYFNIIYPPMTLSS